VHGTTDCEKGGNRKANRLFNGSIFCLLRNLDDLLIVVEAGEGDRRGLVGLEGDDEVVGLERALLVGGRGRAGLGRRSGREGRSVGCLLAGRGVGGMRGAVRRVVEAADTEGHQSRQLHHDHCNPPKNKYKTTK